MWLVASTILDDVSRVRERPCWRDVRRFNAPIQLAVAAAHEVVAHAAAPQELAIISLAPCQAGSPELHEWVRNIDAGTPGRMNPTYTLHAVDNLALSVLSIALGARGWAMSLGGAAGMMWTALEMVLEREEQEVLVVAGDQVDATIARGEPTGLAMLFARERRPYVATGRPTRLAGIDRGPAPVAAIAHATRGAVGMLSALHGGIDTFAEDDAVVRWELA